MPYLVIVLLALVACQAAPLPADQPAAGASPSAALAASMAPPSAFAPATATAPSPTTAIAAAPSAAATTAATSPAASCQPTSSRSSVIVAGRTIPVDVAWTHESRAIGLSNRPCLAKDTGLVLGWDQPNLTRIWMPDMNFAIDVIFVRNGEVIAIYPDAQPCVRGESCPTFGPSTPVDYVLEVPAGSAKAWGLEQGASITLKR